ncbi:hypothetical protein GGE39_005171 [Rhizobium leguminosarum]|nr:hypothetical protein [Rhizobium leguminosarum]
MSIYTFTRQKLQTHGVQDSPDGRIVLSDKRLFLLFVRLERARRLADICIIQSNVEQIALYCKSIGKPHLSIFAYMYILFSDFTPKFTHLGELLPDTLVRYKKDYERSVSQEEIAIGEWALAMYEKYERHFFSAVYRSSR